MVAPQACVAVEISGVPVVEQRAALETRCSDILGARRCRIVAPDDAAARAGCWQVFVATVGGDTPSEASVVLDDASDPSTRP